ncbi:ATP-binding cassette domain-containing protein [Fundicoccus ignavus]|uniref:ATP-binding cassette domain-containing protein n=1 Tax=Fundicoccus ignavus TaxID=2664442 RepID=A0A844BYF7_9LACT|nr:ATP-binding cassette domain-containing protein [Fundicoccus ignavus]MRJ47059.1 ATP-binding cassette domain-containing protein [Fundicoccus ignavus]
MNAIIQTKELRKNFKTEEVLKSIDFNLNEGEICALIGKNGAGKSTFFKLLSGQMIPTSGSIQLFDKKSPHLDKARRRMGFIIESPVFFPDFTGVQNLEYFRLQRGVAEKKRIHEVLKIVGLTNAKHKKFKTYSMGMKQRLGIALCLLSSPDCLVLDEPINGLDSEGIVEIRKLLLQLNQEHHITILVSSHILTELQLIADRFVFIKKGIITEDVSKKQLEEKSEKQLHLQVDKVAKAAQVLESHYPSIQYDVMPEGKIIIYNHIKDAAAINKLLITNDIIVRAFHTEAYKLEEYFLDIVEGEEK